jgi:hypothetical protein
MCAFFLFVAVGEPTEGREAPIRPRAPQRQLTLEREVGLGRSDVLRYRQVVGGYEVLGAEAIVKRTGASSHLIADTTSAAIAQPGGPSVGRAAAVKAATRAAGVERRRDDVTASLAIQPANGGTLVWRVLIPSARPLSDFEVLVDAASGDALAVTDLLRHATGAAMLYDPNPVSKQGSFDGLQDDRDADSPLLTSLREPVALERIEDGQTCLKGAFAMAKLGSRHRRVCDADLDWSDVKRRAGRFEAVMAYFHIDRMQAYIQDLGFPDVNNRRQVVLANSFGGDNAFYSPITKRIELGRGAVDDGEDADVIIHEYGHAIQDAQKPNYGRGFQAAAMGEGFGDYLAAAASTELSAGVSPEHNRCVFEWGAYRDGLSKPFCGRSADIDTTLQALDATSCGLFIHCMGRLWSSALYDLREELGDDVAGRSIIDRDILGAHFYMPNDVSYAGAVAALKCADEDFYPVGDADCVGEHHDAIDAEMSARGYI